MQRCYKYTLVEMLVVMVIAAVLVSIGVPAFTKLTTGGGVDQTASMFKATVEQAQSQAMTYRKPIALVIDIQGSAHGSEQAIRPCIVEIADNNYTFKAWVPESRWRKLDRGAFVSGCHTQKNADPFKSTDTIPATFANLPSIKVKDGAQEYTYSGIVFTPYGSIHRQNKDLYFPISEGIISENRPIYTNKSTDDDTQTDNLIRLSLNPFTGKMEYIR